MNYLWASTQGISCKKFSFEASLGAFKPRISSENTGLVHIENISEDVYERLRYFNVHFCTAKYLVVHFGTGG